MSKYSFVRMNPFASFFYLHIFYLILWIGVHAKYIDILMQKIIFNLQRYIEIKNRLPLLIVG